MGDGDYLYAFQEVIMPIGYEFNPDLVISETPFQGKSDLALCSQGHSIRWV